MQTLVERVVAQPIQHRYITPLPVMKAAAMILPIAFFAPGMTMYFHIDPLVSGGFVVTVASAFFVWASTKVEVVEEREQPEDTSEEPEPQPAAPQPFIEVSKPGPNSLSWKVRHEPPASDDPKRQISLGRADIVLARLATGDDPMEPISWDNAKARGFKRLTNGLGEKTFYDIQHSWIDRGHARLDGRGHCYLTTGGRHALSRYAQQVVN